MIFRQHITSVLIASMIASVPAWAGDNSSGLASVRGATRTVDGLPLPGVRVVVHRVDGNVEVNSDAVSMTAADGTFLIEDLRLGQYQITASKAGFTSSPISLEVSSPEAKSVDFALELAGTSTESKLLRGFELMQKRIEQLEAELQRLGKDHEFHRYDGASHGFFYYHTPMYRPEATMDAWGKVFTFFADRLNAT